jgi:DNA-binding CsgD family transcriptional regulator
MQPDMPFRDLLYQNPHLMPLVHALGLRGPFGSASIRQVGKEQNVLEPVLLNLLEACLCKNFEWRETFPAYGLLQLSELTRKITEYLRIQLYWLPDLIQEQLRAHLDELNDTLLPHIAGIYELYYSPEYTAGKSNLLGYSIEFFPKQALPLAGLQVVEDRLEEGAGDAFEHWETLLQFHRNLELAHALHRVEERLLKPVVLLMEEEIIRTYQKKRSKPLRLAHLTMAETEQPTDMLSKREREVLGLVAQGLMNKEIADKLGISLTTVISHRKNLSDKLGIHSLAGLTVYAYTHGLLDSNILTNED